VQIEISIATITMVGTAFVATATAAIYIGRALNTLEGIPKLTERVQLLESILAVAMRMLQTLWKREGLSEHRLNEFQQHVDAVISGEAKPAKQPMILALEEVGAAPPKRAQWRDKSRRNETRRIPFAELEARLQEAIPSQDEYERDPFSDPPPEPEAVLEQQQPELRPDPSWETPVALRRGHLPTPYPTGHSHVEHRPKRRGGSREGGEGGDGDGNDDSGEEEE